jgi:hypothetical protein
MVGRIHSRSVILLSVLLLILLVQILPQFDLPATAFRQNWEPISIQAAVVVSPLIVMVVSAVHSVPPYGMGILSLLLSVAFVMAANRAQVLYELRC